MLIKYKSWLARPWCGNPCWYNIIHDLPDLAVETHVDTIYSHDLPDLDVEPNIE
jgi:hypothetical protein